MSAVITAKALSKRFEKKTVLNNIDLEIATGRIVGLIGPNGSGKTTTLKAILGLTSFDGELSVLGFNPQTERDALMNEVCFIADVAILPRWLRVGDAIDFIEGVHPKFNRAKAETYLAATKIDQNMRVKTMSKGMVVQLHLALVMAIDAKLLVLDEPTLGLDILYRKMFYQHLLEDYFDEDKTIIIATHQVEEIENILTDLVFIREGDIVLQTSMEQVAERFVEVEVNAENTHAALVFNPIDQRQVFGKTRMIFDSVAEHHLTPFGECRTPSVTNIFVAMMQGSYQ
jgi:ABC-2 type transport system ATP-binding protein